jgi:hypothetical protein
VATAGVTPDEAAVPAGRSARVALLTETEPGRRNRRTVDSVFLLAAALFVGLSAVVASSAARQDRDVAHALTTVFGWAGAFWRAAFFGVLALALAVVVEVLVRRRWDLVRDLLVAVSSVVGMAVVLGRVVASDWLPLEVLKGAIIGVASHAAVR